MPGDNSYTVAPGTPVAFPQNGPNLFNTIQRSDAYTFILSQVGLYMVQFQVSITEAGQLCVELNGLEQPQTVVGRATGTSQLYGTSLIQTSSSNSVLRIINPSGESTALTITPVAGGTKPVSAHLVIMQIA
jgi:hypothetical protein